MMLDVTRVVVFRLCCFPQNKGFVAGYGGGFGFERVSEEDTVMRERLNGTGLS